MNMPAHIKYRYIDPSAMPPEEVFADIEYKLGIPFQEHFPHLSVEHARHGLRQLRSGVKNTAVFCELMEQELRATQPEFN